MENLLETIEKIEKELNGEEKIRLIGGNKKIIFSAPHSVEQVRDGHLKFGEARTAGLVYIMCREKDCYGAFKGQNLQDDANYDEKNYYKDDVIKFIKENEIELLLDLHIMSPKRDIDMEIGTGRGNNILGREDLLIKLKSSLEECGFNIKADYKFTASFKNTVSATVARECKIPCFQVEINWRLLDENSKRENIEGIIESLSKFIDKVEVE